MSNLSVCHVTACQGVRRNCRTAAAAPPPKLWGSSGGGALSAVRSIELPRRLLDCHRSCRSSPAGAAVQSLSPPCRGSIWTSESKPKFLSPNYSHHGQDNPHYESLLVVEVPEPSDAVSRSRSLIEQEAAQRKI